MDERFVDKNAISPQDITACYHSCYSHSSPHPDQEVSFNWLNVDYPYLHDHDHWEFYVVTYGNYIHRINGSEYTMSLGDACLIRPGDMHMLNYKNNNNKGHHISFLFTDEYAKKLFGSINPDVAAKIENGNDALRFTTKNFPIDKIIDITLSLSGKNLSIEEKTLRTKIIIDALFSDFLLQYFVKTSSFPKWLLDFLMILNNPQLKESTLELAKHTSYSYSRLSRLFKEYMETTLVDYIRKIKIQHACNLLTNTSMSVLEISSHVAYDSISYFNKIFKSQIGMSPTEYRTKSRMSPPSELNNSK